LNIKRYCFYYIILFIYNLKTFYLLYNFFFKLKRVEKHRPILIKDITGNEETVSRLQVIAKDGNMPNLIIAVIFL